MSRRSKNILFTTIGLIIYVQIVWVLYWVESSNDDSNIKSFSDALWYSIITLTTIGYGDYFPKTPEGKFIALFFVLGSIGILGFVISQISNKIFKIMEDKKLGYFGTKMENHVVIINWNDFAKQILSEITNANKKAVVITKSKEDVDYVYNHFDSSLVFVLHSDQLDSKTFERANISKCTTILLNFEDDTENLVQLITLKTPFPDLIYVISLNNKSLKKTFNQLGVTFTLAKNEVASKLVASYIFEPEVARITEGLMASAISDEDMGLMQFKMIDANPYLSKKGLDTFIELKTKFNVILVGISKAKDNYSSLVKNPTNDHTIELNDYLVVMGSPKGKDQLTELFRVEEGI
jgi:voltage-gated potassium channel